MPGPSTVTIQDVGAPTPIASNVALEGYTYDYIIIGGGTSGCVLASRLSEDRDVSVLLLEKGQVAETWSSRVPLMSGNPTSKDFKGMVWTSVPQPNVDNRSLRIVRGEALGGATRVNGMLYTRGTPGDYNRWRDLGNPGWGYRDVEPYFVKSEQSHSYTATYRGKAGPWQNSKATDWFRPTTFIDRALQGAGIEHVQDFNSPNAPAACTGFQDHMKDSSSYRHSTDRAFLPQYLVQERKARLKICTNALVTRIEFENSASGIRATGVHLEPSDSAAGAQGYFAKATQEVILCARALVSPQILMLSGLGPKEHLVENGITVVRDLPAVGNYLQDHVCLPMGWEVPLKDSIHHMQYSPLRVVTELLRWMIWGTGLLSFSFQNVSTFFPTQLLDKTFTIAKDDPRNHDTADPGNRPDIEFMHIPSDCAWVIKPRRGAYSYLLTLIRPKSYGSVRLVSSDPRTPPTIDLGYFTNAEDFVPVRAGVRFAMRIADDVRKQGYPFADLTVPESLSDEDIDKFVRKYVTSGYHYASTCRMGAEPSGARASVVDGELKVHGVRGLRVADASVFAEIIGSHTMAPTVMVAEKCADMVKASWAR
ncbi:hypothetical protein V8D89_015144 [Ganoderma adspersum]